MPGGSDIRAGRAFVELYLKNGLTAGLRNASQQLKTFGQSTMQIGGIIAAGGAAITAPFVAAVQQFTSVGDQLDKMRQRTGLSVENLSELAHAAEQSGISLDDVEKALRKMAKEGIDVNKFDQVAAAIDAIQDPTLKAKKAIEVWGKSGTALLPMLGDLQVLRKEARDLGLTMTGEAAASAVKLGDAIDNVMKTVKFAAIAVGEALAPAIQKAVAVIQAITTTALNWVRQNQELFRTIALVAVGVTAVGVAFIAFDAAVSLAGVALGGVLSVLGFVGSAIGFLLSPIGLVIAALAGFGTMFLTTTESGANAISFLGEAFGKLSTEATAAFGAIGHALASGDISTAVNVLWSLIKLEFQRGITYLNGLWQPVANFFRDVWVNAVSNVSKLFIDASATVQKAWMEVVDFFKDSWDIIKTISVKIDDFANGINMADAIEAKANAAIAARDQGRQAAKAKIDQDAAGANATIDKDARKREEDNRLKSEAAIAKAEAELEAAKKGFEAAVATANNLPSAPTGTTPDGQKKKDFQVPNFSTNSVVGTFSGAALAAQGGAGGGGASERNQMEILKENRRQRIALEALAKQSHQLLLGP